MTKKKIGIIISIGILILISFFFYFPKSKKEIYQLETEVKENATYVESITSVITTSDKLNKILKEHLRKQQTFFNDHIENTQHSYLMDRDELNIDCEFTILNDKTWYVALTTSMRGPSFSNPYDRIDCWTWDKETEQVLNLENILSSTIDFSSFQEDVFQKLKKECDSCLTKDTFSNILNPKFQTFQITDQEMILYFNPFLFEDDYFDIIPITLEMNLFSKKQKKEIKKEDKNTTHKASPSQIIDPEKPVVALTFDDGPSQYTEEIIKILKENKVNATFFVLGNKVDRYQEVLRTSVSNGNELGNHSYNHKWLSRLSTKELIDQIDQTQKILKEKVGYTPRYLRPTYGSTTNRIRKNTNLDIALWTVDTKDWKIHNIDRIVDRATNDIEDGDIILMHDIFERSKNALKKIIPILKEKGFQFVTISELEEVKKIRKYEKQEVS